MPRTARPHPVAEAIEAVISWPFTVGMGLLMAARKIWQTRLPRFVRIVALVVLVPPGVLFVFIAFAE
ncbi:hypothetical protein Psi02_58500 [Planotetraspora silvatica]|uniref:Uncharacterized protein n=1 Tax=Planotetraspora silvatica TaxID=234614 RepID=A0A8J3UTX8_9ACTN|nr:hypothetical protein Psi02_58500 [Planotetraspora silvatica]